MFLRTFVLLGLAAAFSGSTALAQRQVSVNIDSMPEGATVTLLQPGATGSQQGQSLGVTPLRNVRVPIGAAVFRFTMIGFDTTDVQATVSRRGETFRATLAPMGVIAIQAGSESAEGAQIRIDGQNAGTVPYRGNLRPGRHLVQVGRAGFVTFNQWVELSGGQVLTLPVILDRERAQTGSILVAPDVSGAQVFLDGQERGTTPTVIDNVNAGTHAIEIRAAGSPTFTQQVTVVAGERTTVTPSMRPAAAPTGTLRIVSNAQGTTLKLDGQDIGTAPSVRENLSPGEHIVEATAPDHEPIQQVVTIEAGATRALSLQLQPVRARPGTIVVNANVGNARVFIDGEQQSGQPPIVREDAREGTHAIVVTAPGHEDFRTTCRVGAGQNCEINATLEPIGTLVRIRTRQSVPGASFYVDGELKGPVPFEGTIAAGQHRFEVRAEGYETHVEAVRLTAGEDAREFTVELPRTGALSDEERAREAEELAQVQMGTVSYAATPLPTDFPILDATIGWPYLIEVRSGIGLTRFSPKLGLDAGVAFRTFGRLTEFEGRVKLGYRPMTQLAVGGQVRFGGGIGPSHTESTPSTSNWCPDTTTETTCSHDHIANTFFMDLEVLGTLNFGSRGAFTLWLGTDFYTDRWDYSGEDHDALVDPGEDHELPRQKGVRLRFGGAFELVLTEQMNATALLEGILVDDGESRRVLGDIFGIGGEDAELYFRLGIGYKF